VRTLIYNAAAAPFPDASAPRVFQLRSRLQTKRVLACSEFLFRDVDDDGTTAVDAVAVDFDVEG
jgi:hypothetical protein